MSSPSPGRRKRGTSAAAVIANPWWLTKKNEAHGELFSVVKILRDQSKQRRSEDAHHRRLYSNMDVAGKGTEHGSVALTFTRDRQGRMRYNLCASAVDTAQSLVASQKPKPMYLTSEGDFKQQRQARLRSRALEGQLDDSGAYEIGPEAMLDGAIEGTGAMFGYRCPDSGEPKAERVLPGELLVDHAEGLNRKPRTLYRQRRMDREVACSLWPEHEAKLRMAAAPTADQRRDWYLGNDETADEIVLVESWRLATKKGAGNGRHVICASNVTLVDEVFTRPRFPFAFYRWKNRRLGFWGSGIVEQCRDAQWRINRTIQRDQRAQDLTANKVLLVDKRSEVTTQHLTNEPFIIVKYNSARGAAPQVVDNSTFDPGTAQRIAQIREETFSELGLSPQSIQGEKPAGLDSGKAIRANDDIHSRRHLEPTKRYERFMMDFVQVLEDLNEEAYEAAKGAGEGAYTITGRVQQGGATLLREVEWSAIRDPDNKLRIRAFPTSFLPSTPQGKMAAVNEIVATGFISRPFAQSLLDFPDLDAATRIELADLDFVQWQVERILDGHMEVPDPHQDLSFALELGRKSYLAARVNQAPESVLDDLRNYLRMVDRLLNPPASNKTVPGADAAPGAPPVPPEAQPPMPGPAAPGVAA